MHSAGVAAPAAVRLGQKRIPAIVIKMTASKINTCNRFTSGPPAGWSYQPFTPTVCLLQDGWIAFLDNKDDKCGRKALQGRLPACPLSGKRAACPAGLSARVYCEGV